jgi:hypothetical protein
LSRPTEYRILLCWVTARTQSVWVLSSYMVLRPLEPKTKRVLSSEQIAIALPLNTFLILWILVAVELVTDSSILGFLMSNEMIWPEAVPTKALEISFWDQLRVLSVLSQRWSLFLSPKEEHSYHDHGHFTIRGWLQFAINLNLIDKWRN